MQFLRYLPHRHDETHYHPCMYPWQPYLERVLELSAISSALATTVLQYKKNCNKTDTQSNNSMQYNKSTISCQHAKIKPEWSRFETQKYLRLNFSINGLLFGKAQRCGIQFAFMNFVFNVPQTVSNRNAISQPHPKNFKVCNTSTTHYIVSSILLLITHVVITKKIQYWSPARAAPNGTRALEYFAWYP